MALAAGVPLSLSERTLGMGTKPSAAATGLTKAAFEAQLNTKFLINLESSKLAVTLVEVANLGTKKSGKEGFSLLFRGPKETTLQQNTYLIEHENLGMFSFLIVPMKTKDKRAADYEAVINRLHP
jgi:hypothetical protein